MRGCMLFVAGLAMGLMVQTLAAQNMTPNRGLIGLNHVGIAVPNLNEASHVLHEDVWGSLRRSAASTRRGSRGWCTCTSPVIRSSNCSRATLRGPR